MEGGFEVLFQMRQQLMLRAALENLRNKGPARIENLRGEIRSQFDKRNDTYVIGRAMAGGRRGHIG